MAARTHGPRRAVDTQVVRQLESEWGELALSRRFVARLRAWSAETEILDFADGEALVEATRDRPSGPGETCKVLEALVIRAPSDELALRSAVQVMLPRFTAIIDSIGGIDLDERAAMVFAIGCEMILSCPPDTARTPIDYRLYVNTRRKAIRAATRERSRAEDPVPTDDLEWCLERPAPTDDMELTPGRGLEELLRWVRRHAHVDEDVARLMVLTRACDVPLADLAQAGGVSVPTLRQRRLRAERRLRESLEPRVA